MTKEKTKNVFSVSVPKLGKTYSIDWDKMPKATQDYVIAYGLKQTLNDKIASFTKAQQDDPGAIAEAKRMVDSRFSQLMDGILPKGGGGVQGDAVLTQARLIATTRIKAAIKAKGLTIKAVTAQTSMPELVRQVLANDPSIMDLAQKAVDAERNLTADTSCLDGMFQND